MRWGDDIERGCEIKSLVQHRAPYDGESIVPVSRIGLVEDLVLPKRDSGAVGLMHPVKK